MNARLSNHPFIFTTSYPLDNITYMYGYHNDVLFHMSYPEASRLRIPPGLQPTTGTIPSVLLEGLQPEAGLFHHNPVAVASLADVEVCLLRRRVLTRCLVVPNL